MMAAATDSTSLVPIQPVFTDAERLALAGYLAGYRGLTREAYTLDLRSRVCGEDPASGPLAARRGAGTAGRRTCRVPRVPTRACPASSMAGPRVVPAGNRGRRDSAAKIDASAGR
jgi:hypothetical protein